MVFPGRETVFHLAPNHSLDNAVFVYLIAMHTKCFNGLSIPDNSDAVGDCRNFMQLVRDENAADAFLPELPHQLQQQRAFLVVQSCRRFVQNQKSDILGNCLADFNQLLFSDTEVADLGLRIFMQTDTLHQLGCPADGQLPVDDAVLCIFISEKDILCNGKRREKSQMLMNDCDIFLFALTDIPESAEFSVVINLSAIAPIRINTAEDIHKC